jgi:hypothetical protein
MNQLYLSNKGLQKATNIQLHKFVSAEKVHILAGSVDQKYGSLCEDLYVRTVYRTQGICQKLVCCVHDWCHPLLHAV